MKQNTSNIKTAIDQLGDVREQQRALKAREDALRSTIIALGTGVHEGDIFEASVVESEKHSLDQDAVRAKLAELHVSNQWIVANTKRTEVITVRTKLRAPVVANLVRKSVAA